MKTEDEFKEGSSKHILSKFEFDLYDEEQDKVNKVIRIKRVKLPKEGESWKIIEDSKTILLIEGVKLSKKEKAFIKTPEGINYLLKIYKTGANNIIKIRAELKKVI
jgi:hypothetical protein